MRFLDFLETLRKIVLNARFFFIIMEHVWKYAVEQRQFFATDKALHEHLIEKFPAEHIAYATLTHHLRRELWSEEAREGRKKIRPRA